MAVEIEISPALTVHERRGLEVHSNRARQRLQERLIHFHRKLNLVAAAGLKVSSRGKSDTMVLGSETGLEKRE